MQTAAPFTLHCHFGILLPCKWGSVMRSREDKPVVFDRDGVVSEVARTIRRSRKQVYRWIASHRLDVKRYRR
jgi:hypothetical protein